MDTHASLYCQIIIILFVSKKLTETKPGEYEGVYLNPKDISPDDLDGVMLCRIIKEAGMFYRMELKRVS